MSKNERETIIEFTTAAHVANYDVYCPILKINPLLAKLMLDQFKSFLNNSYFTCLERQSVLMKFLTQPFEYELTQEILQFLYKDLQEDLQEDYKVIIMEWTFHNSSKIKQSLLAKFDAITLCNDINEPIWTPPKQTDEDVLKKIISDLGTKLLIVQDDNDTGETL